jgi:hypothetical protein
MSRFTFYSLIVGLILLMGCQPEEPLQSVVVTRSTSAAPATAAVNALDRFVAALTERGAAVRQEEARPAVTFGQSELVVLAVNDQPVVVYVFADTAARQVVSEGISADGSEYLVSDGEQSIVTHMDFIGVPYFWASDNLLVNYAGEDQPTLDLLNGILGEPFADGNRINQRPEEPGERTAGFSEYGISVLYDQFLAYQMGIEIVPARTAEDVGDQGLLIAPAHIAITFQEHYATDFGIVRQVEAIPAEPQIRIYPAETYAAMNQPAGGQIGALQNLLAEQPADPHPLEPLPMLPPVDGFPVVTSQVAYLEFQQGQGVRYVTQVNRQIGPVNNQELFYTFQGMTADNAYVVVAYFPVQTDALPATAADAGDQWSQEYVEEYLPGVLGILSGQTAADFQPDLTLLDMVIQNLRVEPTVELAEAAPTPTVTPTAAATPIPIEPAPVLVSPQPLFSGHARLLDWSPDGRWLAYFEHSPEQLAQNPFPQSPASVPGTFILYDMETGAKCQRYLLDATYPHEGGGPSQTYTWLANGDFFIITQNGDVIQADVPCGQEENLKGLFAGQVTHIAAISPGGALLLLGMGGPYAIYDSNSRTVIPIAAEISHAVHAVWSPGGTWLAMDGWQFSEAGTVVAGGTRIVETATGRVVASHNWEPGTALDGIFGVPVWLNETEMVLPITLDQGPLRLTVAGEVEPLLPLFGREWTPPGSYTNVPFVKAHVEQSSGIYHLLLTTEWTDRPYQPMLLYHSETNEVETLGALASWSEIRADGRIVAAYPNEQAHPFWTRLLDPSGQPVQSIGFSPCLLESPTAPMVAYADQDNQFLILTEPTNCAEIGRLQIAGYNDGSYNFRALASPDGRWLATLVSNPNGWGQALFVVPLSEVID